MAVDASVPALTILPLPRRAQAPAFIVDSASSFFENVTIAVLSNGGSAEFHLIPGDWPSPSAHSMVNVQVAHGHFVWRQTPTASETVSYAGLAAVASGARALRGCRCSFPFLVACLPRRIFSRLRSAFSSERAS